MYDPTRTCRRILPETRRSCGVCFGRLYQNELGHLRASQYMLFVSCAVDMSTDYKYHIKVATCFDGRCCAGDRLDSFVDQLVSRPIALERISRDEDTVPADEQILERICLGDSEALAILFRRYFRIAQSIGRKILRDHSEADDLVQEVFLYIWRKCGVYDRTKGLASSWIVQTIYYQALQRRIQLASRNRHTFDIKGEVEFGVRPASGTTEYEQSLEGIMGRARLREMLNSLTDNQWETLRLHFFEGYTLSEIARKKEQSLGNIRHHFYRGLEKLRSHVFRSELQDRITSGTR